MTAIVELKNVTKAVSNGMNEEKVILDDVSLEILDHNFGGEWSWKINPL